MTDSSHHEARTVFRWEVAAKHPLLSHNLLLLLFPNAVDTPATAASTALQAPPSDLLRAVRQLVTRVTGVASALGFAAFAGFSALWYVGRRLAHPEWFRILAYGLSAWLLFYIVVEAVKGVLKASGLHRRSQRRTVTASAVVCLPLLMYATAAPGADFLVATSSTTPEFVDWLEFFGYMLINLVTLGATEGLIGLVTAVQPSSWRAAASTFAIELFMTLGLVSILLDTIRRALRPVHTFVGTVSHFRAWAKKEFADRADHFLVKPIAVEKPFQPDPSAHVPLARFLKANWPEWDVDSDGALVGPGGISSDEEADAWMTLFHMFGPIVAPIAAPEAYKKSGLARQAELRKRFGRWTSLVNRLQVTWVFIVLGALVLLMVGVYAVPAFLLLYLPLGQSTATAVVGGGISGLFLFHLGGLRHSRRRGRRFVHLARIFFRASGTPVSGASRGATSEERELLNGLRKERGSWASDRAVVAADRPRGVLWVLHTQPLRSDREVARVIFDPRSKGILVVDSSARFERIHGVRLPGWKAIRGCHAAMVMYWPDGDPPRHRADVHEVALETQSVAKLVSEGHVTELSQP